jgi:selenocysteine lyase/cysteine desulfurase
MAGAMRYLASIGGEEGDDRTRLRRGMDRIRAYEVGLIEALLTELSRVPGLGILGDSDPGSAAIRVPTVSFRIEGRSPQQIVEGLAALSIQARDGHMYSPRLILASGVEVETGVARVSLCHYNTHAEIARLGEALRSI